jgi:hypothetical protein
VPKGHDSNADGGANPNESFRDRVSHWFLKPVDPSAPHAPVADPLSLEELQEEQRYANDRERAIGLVVAPIAALLSFILINADIRNDPVQYLKGGALNPKYTPLSTYHELLVVLLALSLLMLAMAWFRKRLFLGIAVALYGLALFNLHWWGFGAPFIMVGAWYLVRAYRVQRAVKEATDAGPSTTGGNGSGPRASKRYTPPSAPKRRPLPKHDPNGEQRAG